MRTLNSFEIAEFLLDEGSKANLNFAVISSYRGKLNSTVVQTGLKYLQQKHPLLRVVVDTSEKISRFIETTALVPFKEYPYEGPDQWRVVIKKDLAQRFSKETDPLWRVSLLRDDNEGQILVTFHHAIADGVCAMYMMHHLYQICSELLNDRIPEQIKFSIPAPDLKNLYSLTLKEPSENLLIPSREDKGYHMNFMKDVMNEFTTKQVIEWTKAQEIRVHATLFAAFLQAVRRIVNPKCQQFTAVTAVNYRPFFRPPFSKEELTLLRTCISDKFCVKENEDFTALAKAIHQSVHAQLEAGEHVINLKNLEMRLLQNPTSKELWQRAKFPANTLTVTNLGNLEFTGDYPKLSVNELFFVANTQPFIEESTNFMLAVVTFQSKIFLSLWFLDELVEESLARSILLEMKKILQTHTT